MIRHTSLFILCLSLTFASLALAAPTNKSTTKGLGDDAIYEQLQELHADRKRIDVFTFTRSGKWVIIAEDKAYFSSRKLFEKLKDADGRNVPSIIEGLLSQGRTIDVVTFTNKGNWIIVAGKQRIYSNESAFDGIGLRPQLERLIRDGKEIDSITVGDDRRWIIVAGGRGYSNNLSGELPEIIRNAVDVEKRTLKGVWFRPGRSEWLVLADHTYWSSTPISNRIDGDFNRMRRRGWSVDLIALNNANGAVLVSNEEIVVAPDDLAGRLELAIAKSSGATRSMWDFMQSESVPGVAIAIVEDNKVTTVRGYGRRIAGKGYVKHDTIFSVASMSKAVASYGILALIDDGHLDWESTPKDIAETAPDSLVADWLNRVSAMGLVTDASEHILLNDRANKARIADLLTHTAGMNRWGIGLQSLSANQGPRNILMGTGKYNNSDGVVRPLNEPRTVWGYSGGGFTVAQVMVEAATEVPFSSLMQMKVLGPLGMEDSTFERLTDAQKKRLAFGHTRKGAAIQYRECPGDAAGGLYSTAGDYATFVTALMAPGKAKNSSTGQRVLSEEGIRRMFMPAHRLGSEAKCLKSANCPGVNDVCVLNRCIVPIPNASTWSGAGIRLPTVIGNDRRPAWFSHGGTQRGYESFFAASIDDGTAIVILTNGKRDWKTVVPKRDSEAADDKDCTDYSDWVKLSSGDREDLEEANAPPCGHKFRIRGAVVLTTNVFNTFRTLAWSR